MRLSRSISTPKRKAGVTPALAPCVDGRALRWVTGWRDVGLPRSDETEVPEGLFDCLPLFGRARHEAAASSRAGGGSARRSAGKSTDVRDPSQCRDEAVAPLHELLNLGVRRRHAVGTIFTPQNLRWTTIRMNPPTNAAATIANRISA